MTIINYQNGNANITLETDGTRVIEFEDILELEYPLNIDIRVQKHCSLGLNQKNGKSICHFCHESATTDGLEADYDKLLKKLDILPSGIELAIGCNALTDSLISFLKESSKRFITNLTINQYHLKKYENQILIGLDEGWIKGLGISFRDIDYVKRNPTQLINHPNVVWHVISGIDSIKDIGELSNLGVKKILVLGEKDFGFNIGRVDLSSRKHKEWVWWIGKLFDLFEVVSFDNLALQQLNIQRFLNKKDWGTFYQGEYSFYINAVDGYLSPSSRNPEKVDWNQMDLKNYFKQCQK
jgi:hypothetical protein